MGNLGFVMSENIAKNTDLYRRLVTRNEPTLKSLYGISLRSERQTQFCAFYPIL
jgi:hypothetical protein